MISLWISKASTCVMSNHIENEVILLLSIYELKNYASLRGLSIRDIEAYCELNAGHISNIFNGERPLNEDNHRKIANAINAAYSAKLNGTFKRLPLDENKNVIKAEERVVPGSIKPASKGRKNSVAK